jgi:hypothetical protein
MSTVILSAVLALAEVISTTQCPDSAAIKQRLRSLLSPSATSTDRATIDESLSAIRVEVRDAAGANVGVRALPLAGSCDDRADAVAVVIAAWESDVGRRAAAHTPTATPVPESAAIVATSPTPSQLTWDVSASFLGTIAGGAFAAGASADVTLGKRGFPLAARIGVAGSDNRDLTLAGGRASWTRAALMFGPVFDVVSQKGVRLDVHADIAAGWMFVQGRGFSANYSDNGFDPALGGGARLALTKWSIEPWIDCTLLGWLRHQTVSVPTATSTASTEIPRFDVWLRAGVAYGKR